MGAELARWGSLGCRAFHQLQDAAAALTSDLRDQPTLTSLAAAAAAAALSPIRQASHYSAGLPLLAGAAAQPPSAARPQR